jgi:hypothetical protein
MEEALKLLEDMSVS